MRAARYRLGRPPLILLYHRICETTRDPWGICVGPKRFAEHLAVLAKSHRVVSLAELLRHLDRGEAPQGAVVLTFDDGYRDNLTHAKPLLERFDAPATLFVTAGAVGSERELWWDELERLLLDSLSLPSPLELEIDGRTHRWELGDDARLATGARVAPGWRAGRDDPTRRHEVYTAVYRALRRLPATSWEPVLEQLRSLVGGDASAEPRYSMLSHAELTEISDDGLVEIGSHTVTHPLLAALPVEAQRRELADSKRDLEAILGRPVPSFAYPHGGARDFTSDTARMAREVGYTSAAAAFGGLVTPGVDRYRLPRMGVDNWGAEEFARRLRYGLSL